jgi:kinesin family protein 20
MLEENAECRLAIFKDLIGECDTQDESTNGVCSMKVKTEVC